ncbi:MAG: nitroreductase family protein [Pseudomonadota bacterium]|jgi:nitroreductase|nr:nitroreductase family protein [Pseudomonadota bacterium]
MDIFEVIYNCRSMRRLDVTPVPEELLVKLVDAANQAASGSNMQQARWIVVTDPAVKKKLAELNRTGVENYIGPQNTRPDTLPHQSKEKRLRMLEAVIWQMENMHDMPAIIMACMEFEVPVDDEMIRRAGGSIWPGIQNLLLAARALGLGATPTTLALGDRAAVAEALHLPPFMAAFCLIPIGYPLGRFGPVTRKPVEQIMRWNQWD